MEVINRGAGVERRRRRLVEGRLRIMAEADVPGAIIPYAARRHDVRRGLLSAIPGDVRALVEAPAARIARQDDELNDHRGLIG